MQLAQAQLFLHFLAWAFVPNLNKIIWQFQLMVDSSMLMAAWSSDLDNQKSGATVQTEGHTLTPPKQLNRPWGDRSIWLHPITFTIPVSSEEANAWLPRDLVLFGSSSYLNWRWRNYTTTSTYLAGASGGRHALRWQIWPHGSGCDRPRPGHPILWKMIPRRRT